MNGYNAGMRTLWTVIKLIVGRVYTRWFVEPLFGPPFPRDPQPKPRANQPERKQLD
jgi:hypothetical protein